MGLEDVGGNGEMLACHGEGAGEILYHYCCKIVFFGRRKSPFPPIQEKCVVLAHRDEQPVLVVWQENKRISRSHRLLVGYHQLRARVCPCRRE